MLLFSFYFPSAAIMMRCLQAVSLLIPDLRRHFEWRLDRQQHVLLTQFDIVIMVIMCCVLI